MCRLGLALVALLPVACAAGPDYADELRDMKSAMETVRMETEGSWRPRRARGGAVRRTAAPARTEDSKRAGLLSEALRPGALDKELLGAADRVREDLATTLGEAPAWRPTRPKRAALATESHLQESGQKRAARYFAEHGMRKAAEMLGLDASLQKAASAARATAARPDEGRRGSAGADPLAAHRWQKVDAIKLRRPAALSDGD